MCGLVCWLLLVVVILQAPVGDAGAACNRPSDAPTTRVLLDSYDFQSLLMLADPWNSVGTPVTVSSSYRYILIPLSVTKPHPTYSRYNYAMTQLFLSGDLQYHGY